MAGHLLLHVGEPTTAAIAPALSLPLKKRFAQLIAAPERVFEAIPKLELASDAGLVVLAYRNGTCGRECTGVRWVLAG